jgi:N utilization substance protein B
MLSRRQIRVKVMQTLYSLASSDAGELQVQVNQGTVLLKEKIERTLDFFQLSLLYIARTAQYAEVDAAQRRSKRLPTAEDLAVSTRISANEAVWRLLEDATFNQRLKDRKLEGRIEEDWVRRVYKDLAATTEYEEYIASSAPRTAKSEAAILLIIWRKMMFGSEYFQSLMTDEFPDWEDDAEMTAQMIENYFRSPAKVNFLVLLSAEKREYAVQLLQTTLERHEHVMTLIQPKLQNWDPERLALIDIILLRMGVCELLYFPTIPTKVTINEYIDIAKAYSTAQSGQFVNGVLDNLLKDLERQGNIRKIDRVRKS